MLTVYFHVNLNYNSICQINIHIFVRATFFKYSLANQRDIDGLYMVYVKRKKRKLLNILVYDKIILNLV